MADLFFEKRNEDKAQEILYNAIELCKGNSGGLRLAAYMFEKWKYFDKAIAIYKGLLRNNENNLMIKRNLALAYFQNKNFEEAVKTYYSIITAPDEENCKSNVKENALAEMNAVLAMHKNEFEISYINRNLLKALPVDLRITVEANNYYYVDYPQITEPGNTTCNYNNTNSVNGGRFSGISNYRYDHDLSEYTIKNATAGKYRIKVNSYLSKIPTYVRVISFKNFQKPNMELEIKIFDLDNQYGTVELDAVIW
jgi:tetratricopeptide (TPR) repeat protein